MLAYFFGARIEVSAHAIDRAIERWSFLSRESAENWLIGTLMASQYIIASGPRRYKVYTHDIRLVVAQHILNKEPVWHIITIMVGGYKAKIHQPIINQQHTYYRTILMHGITHIAFGLWVFRPVCGASPAENNSYIVQSTEPDEKICKHCRKRYAQKIAAVERKKHSPKRRVA